MTVVAINSSVTMIVIPYRYVVMANMTVPIAAMKSIVLVPHAVHPPILVPSTHAPMANVIVKMNVVMAFHNVEMVPMKLDVSYTVFPIIILTLK